MNRLVFCGTLAVLIVGSATASDFQSNWPEQIQQTWIGPEYWANRLQDWRIANGRLECVEDRAQKPMRTVHLLTRRLSNKPGEFQMSVKTGLLGDSAKVSPIAAAGFLVGAGGGKMDYRAAALVHHHPGRGGGLFAGIDQAGRVVFHDFEKPLPDGVGSEFIQPNAKTAVPQHQADGIELRLVARPTGDTYTLALTSYDIASGAKLDSAEWDDIPAERLAGNVALVSHPGTRPNTARFWFSDWKVSGSKVEAHDDDRCGPIICTQYTLHRARLKLTAQLMPISEAQPKTVRLQIKDGSQWQTVAETEVIIPGYTATFSVKDWNYTQDVTYRVVCELRNNRGQLTQYASSGTIRRDPKEKNIVVVAAFTGNSNCGYGADTGPANQPNSNDMQVRWTSNNIWFPHNDVVKHVAQHKPDLLFFSGDQVYEGRSPTNAERNAGQKTELDYLYKWYLWCLAYADLTRDIQCVCIPDDHDVFHPNLWGWGGRESPGRNHNNGGYTQEPGFVRMVERTQTSHLPDPYDPTPIHQGIGVYYTALNVGGISFAILEDRKFKSPPTIVSDACGIKINDGHIMRMDFDTRKADLPNAILLGDRQLRFLNDWATDWAGGVQMKAALSQTIFANLQTRSVYPDNLDRDLDSNGWPQTGRAKALRELRRCFAVHIGGDQHLASVIHHGINDWDDAVWSFCVPSVANFYLRFWHPPHPPQNHVQGMTPFMGRCEDGFHNKLTIQAVANPIEKPQPGQFPEPVELHRKSPGYGVVKFNKAERTVTFECWPRYANPAKADGAGQYPGWPVTVRQTDNYELPANVSLPKLKFSGMTDPVVQVIDEDSNETVYVLRIKGTSIKPNVPKPGSYTVCAGEPGTGKTKTLQHLRATQDNAETIEIEF